MKLSSETFAEVKQVPGWHVTNAVRQEVLQWIEALKSGSYKQGFNNLRFKDSYCCLGVLSSLQGAEWKIIDDEYHPTYDGISADNSYLSEAIAKKFNMGERGLSVEVVDYRGNIRWVTLASLNDQGVPFNEIADIIGLALRGGYAAPPKKPEQPKEKKSEAATEIV